MKIFRLVDCSTLTTEPDNSIDVRLNNNKQLNVVLRQIQPNNLKDNKRIVRISVKLTIENKLSIGDVLRSLQKAGCNISATTIYCCNTKGSFQLRCPINKADRYFLPLPELGGELELQWRDLNGAKPKRVKERDISEVVYKVAEWRKLYAGIIDSKGAIRKYTLEEAADIVGIAKKTLDDYLLQIRIGRIYGFDFNKYCHEKIGVLRAFVKTLKSKQDIDISY